MKLSAQKLSRCRIDAMLMRKWTFASCVFLSVLLVGCDASSDDSGAALVDVRMKDGVSVDMLIPDESIGRYFRARIYDFNEEIAAELRRIVRKGLQGATQIAESPNYRDDWRAYIQCYFVTEHGVSAVARIQPWTEPELRMWITVWWEGYEYYYFYTLSDDDVPDLWALEAAINRADRLNLWLP